MLGTRTPIRESAEPSVVASDDLSDITGLPAELGIDDELDKGTVHLDVRTETRRYGKPVTIVEGFHGTGVDLDELASELKRALATGGTVQDGTIELQGDHDEAARALLEDEGYRVGST